MDLDVVAKLSKLSRGQIAQLISRYGYVPHGKAIGGGPRNYTKGDAFDLVVAGHLSALGLDQPTIVAMLTSMPLPEIDPSTFEQVEVFPGRRAFSESDDTAYLLIVTEASGDSESTFVAEAELRRRLSSHPAAIVLNASAIAEAIDESWAQAE